MIMERNYVRSFVEWHDLAIDPEDLPSEEEPIMVTVETPMGRRTWFDNVFMKEETVGEPIFYIRALGHSGILEEEAIWYPVLAWAYPPDPMEE